MANVLILLGSASDREYFDGMEKFADFFCLKVELQILSAHRNPEELRQKLARVSEEGVEVIIAAAGMAAHLAGACAAETILPVIGVPLPGSPLQGMDALLSTVQMPSGIPVATVSIGKAGAQNALILAARILALKNPALAEKLQEFRKRGARL